MATWSTTRDAMAMAVLLAGAASCSPQGPKLLDPELTVTQVVVQSVGLAGGNLDIQVDVGNPNAIPLNVIGIDAGFDVERAHVGEIHSTRPFVVPETGRTQVTLPVRFTWSGAGEAFRSALGYGDIPFLMRGQVRLDVRGHEVSIPFTREGRVAVKTNVRIPTGSSR